MQAVELTEAELEEINGIIKTEEVVAADTGKIIQVTWMDEQKAQIASIKPCTNFSVSRQVHTLQI